jgi:hypothetical protein
MSNEDIIFAVSDGVYDNLDPECLGMILIINIINIDLIININLRYYDNLDPECLGIILLSILILIINIDSNYKYY